MGCSAFARHYLRNHCCFLFHWLLRCFTSPGVATSSLWIQEETMPVPASGYPIRRSPGHSLLAANRGLSQLAHVLHRLLAPRHSLCALKSLFSCFMSLFRPRRAGKRHYKFSPYSLRSQSRFSRMKLQFFYPVCRCQRPSDRFDALERRCTRKGMVGQTGLEPVTPRLSSACSNQLSYRPFWNSNFKSGSEILQMVVEATGFEPVTFCVQNRRSTN